MAFSDQIKSLQEQMQGFDVSELSVDNIGTWPLPIKILTWIAIFAGIIFGGYKFIINDLQIAQAAAIEKEGQLKKQFEDKAFQAANLEAYRNQMKEMKGSFGALISQLPSDTEVPGLLEDISNRGSSSGLVFNAITLQREIVREFYIELPIKISATGTFHDMGAFVSGVASLSRIVTLTNFSIKPQGRKGDSSRLLLNITASTYRYRAAGGSGKGKAGKGKKK